MAVPAFVKDGGMLRRQCTKEFKIAPITSRIFVLADRGRKHVWQWFGISADEISRMSTSDRLYVRHHYPLVDRGFTREDCETWLAAKGWSAPRSACVGCPYHSDREWAAMTPDLLAEAAQFERDMREDSGIDVYLHRSCIPLLDVTFKGRSAGGEECGGYCWT